MRREKGKHEDPWEELHHDGDGYFLETRDFRKYMNRISDLINASEYAMSIGDIHRALGEDANTRWTADALESLNGIEEVGIKPTRYRPKGRPDVGVRIDSRDQLQRIFTR